MKIGLNIKSIKLISDLDVLEVVKLGYKFVTFDLFDTLIYRKYIQYNDVVNLTNSFFAVGDEYSFNKFDGLADRRQHITNIVRDSSVKRTREPLLSDILQLTYGAFTEDGTVGKAAEKFEFDLEYRNLHLIPGACEKLSQLVDAGVGVALISDMYFDKKRIESLLEKFKIKEYFSEHIFVSSDLKETKHEGGLFPLVLSALNVHAKDVLHIGDNKTSDIYQSSQVGIDSIFISSVYKEPDCYDVQTDRQKIVTVFSQLMATHLLASLAEARRLKVDNCFFLSRDGDVLERIWNRVSKANALLNRYFGGIRTSALAINRQRGLLLEMRILNEEQFLDDLISHAAMLGWGRVSIIDLCASLGVNPPVGVSTEKMDRTALIKVIKESNLGSLLFDAVQRNRQETFKYLKSKNIVASKSLFSDIGYSGTVMRNIIYYLQREWPEECNNTKIYSFLMATNGNYHSNDFFSRPFGRVFKGSVFDCSNTPEIMTDNFSWLEWAFKNWKKGTLVGYNFESEQVVGVFEDSQHATPEILNEIEEAAVAILIDHPCPELLISQNFITLLRNRCVSMFETPSKSFLEELEELTHDRSGLAVEVGSLFEKDSLVKALYKMRSWKNTDVWISGSLTASGAGFMIPFYSRIKQGIRSGARIKYKLKKVLRLVH